MGRIFESKIYRGIGKKKKKKKKKEKERKKKNIYKKPSYRCYINYRYYKYNLNEKKREYMLQRDSKVSNQIIYYTECYMLYS